MVKNSFITIFIFFVLAGLSSRTLACSCGGRSVESAFDLSYAVFTGKVIKIEPVKMQRVTKWVIDEKTRKIRKTDNLQLSEEEWRKVTFEVIENFKEVRNDLTKGNSKTIEVLTEVLNGEGTCGFPFKVGTQYLVFAGGREPFFSKEDAKLPVEKWTDLMIFQSQADKLNESLPFYGTSVCHMMFSDSIKQSIEKVRSLSRIGLPKETNQR